MTARLHVLYQQRGLSREEHKAMIARLTEGRTDKTNELTEAEANYLAGFLAASGGNHIRDQADDKARSQLRWYRSAVLKRLQQMGIDTSDWSRVNAFLGDKRIAGAPLYKLTTEDLKRLIPKLEKICEKKTK